MLRLDHSKKAFEVIAATRGTHNVTHSVTHSKRPVREKAPAADNGRCNNGGPGSALAHDTTRVHVPASTNSFCSKQRNNRRAHTRCYLLLLP